MELPELTPRHLLVLVLTGAVALVALWSVAGPKQVKVRGGGVVISRGLARHQASLGPSLDVTLLFKDEGRVLGPSLADLFLTVMPLETAEGLKAQFGDPFTCGGAGQSQAMAAIEPVMLVGADASVRATLRQAAQAMGQGRIPVMVLRVRDMQMAGEEGQTWWLVEGARELRPTF